jgi:hypothetical protein
VLVKGPIFRVNRWKSIHTLIGHIPSSVKSTLLTTCFMGFSCLVIFCPWRRKQNVPPKRRFNFQQITRRYISEDMVVYYVWNVSKKPERKEWHGKPKHRWENIKILLKISVIVVISEMALWTAWNAGISLTVWEVNGFPRSILFHIITRITTADLHHVPVLKCCPWGLFSSLHALHHCWRSCRDITAQISPSVHFAVSEFVNWTNVRTDDVP